MAKMKRVLVAEDNPELKELMIERLIDQGFDVHAADDGRQAYDIAERLGEFDLIVTDFQMPRMDGCELAAAVRKMGHRCPILIMTGAPDEAAKKHRELGLRYCSVIDKMNFKDLDHVLKTCLNGS